MRINVGTTANDRTGDPARTWARKFNARFAVKSMTTTAQPGSPAEDDAYIVPASATGADWAGQDGNVALFIKAAWVFMAPSEGWRFWVEDEDKITRYDGSAWGDLVTGGGGGGIAEAPNDGGYYARRNEAWVEFTPGGGAGGAIEATLIKTARYTMSGDQVASAGGVVVDFDSLDSSWDDVGFTISGGVLTATSVLDGKRLKLTAQIGSSNGSAAHKNIYFRKNGSDIHGIDGYSQNSAGDYLAVSPKMAIATGDTFAIVFRDQLGGTITAAGGGGQFVPQLFVEVEETVTLSGNSDFLGFARYDRPGDIFTAENEGVPAAPNVNAYQASDDTWLISTEGDRGANFAARTGFAGNTDFDVAAVLTTRLHQGGGIFTTGIFIGNSSSGKKMLLALDENGTVYSQLWTNTAFGSTAATYEYADCGPSLTDKVYFRVARSGTDYLFYISQNGLDWDLVNTLTTSSHGTFGDADEVGFFLTAGSTVATDARCMAKCIGWNEDGPQPEATTAVSAGTGGGAGVSNFVDLSEVESGIDFSAFGAADDDRLVGIKEISPGVRGLAILDKKITANPLGGGAEVIFDQTFSSGAPSSGFDITGVDKFDRVVIVGWYIDPNDTVFMEFSDDSGATVESHDFVTQHLTASGATPSISGAEVTQTNFSLIDNADNTHFKAVIEGLQANAGYITVEVDRFTIFPATDTFGRRKSIHAISNVNAIKLRTNSGSATIDGGRIVAYGVKANIQPMAIPFDYTGSPGTVATLARFVAPIDMRIAAGNQGAFQVAGNPTGAAVVNIKQNGTTRGTISIATDGTCTVNITAQTDISKGDLIILESDGAEDFTDLFGALFMVARDA